MEQHSPKIFTGAGEKDNWQFSTSKLRKATVDFSEVIAASKLGNSWDNTEPCCKNIEATIDELLEKWIETEIQDKQAQAS